MKTAYGYIELNFQQEFSNVLIVHITCDSPLEPELNEHELVSLSNVMCIEYCVDIISRRTSWDSSLNLLVM